MSTASPDFFNRIAFADDRVLLAIVTCDMSALDFEVLSTFAGLLTRWLGFITFNSSGSIHVKSASTLYSCRDDRAASNVE